MFVRLRGDRQYNIHTKSLEHWHGSKVDQLIFISPAIQGCKVFVSQSILICLVPVSCTLYMC